MNRKILVMGLPGAGKTTLARLLAKSLPAVHFNADEVRAQISRDLGFSVADRIEHARRMGWLCEQVTRAGGYAIADFVCPTAQTRAAFGVAFVVWVDRIIEGRFADTNRLFVAPETVDVRVTAEGSPAHWTGIVVAHLAQAERRALESDPVQSLFALHEGDALTRDATSKDIRILRCRSS